MQTSQIRVLWVSCFSNVHRYNISVFPYLAIQMKDRKPELENSDRKYYCKHIPYKHFTRKEMEYFILFLYGTAAYTVFIISLLLSYKL